MSRWTCPACDREFARARQAHVCVPGCTVDQTFAGRPDYQRAAYEKIVEAARDLGPVHDDAVSVGVFLKADRKFAEIRPKARSLSVALLLPRRITDPMVQRTFPAADGSAWHMIKITSAEADDRLLDWVAEAYLAAVDSPADPASPGPR